MLNNESLTDIFASEEEEQKCDKLCDLVSSSNEVSLDSLNTSTVLSGDPSEIKCDENSVDSLNLFLDASEETRVHRPESQSSEDSYLSLNTSMSFEDHIHKDQIFNNNSVSRVFINTPDMFGGSQGSQESPGVAVEENQVNKSPETEASETNRSINSESSSENRGQEESYENWSLEGEGCSRDNITSSNSDGSPELSVIPEEEPHCSQDFQFQRSQGSHHAFPGRLESPDPQDTLNCREPQEPWDSQEIARVSERLALRRKQARRLILTVIRKRQMAKETLDAFKKRLKRF